MKIGITGSTGFLGKKLTELLVSKDHSIKALVRKTSIIENINKLDVEFIVGDINKPESLDNFIKDIELCYHTVAKVGDSS